MTNQKHGLPVSLASYIKARSDDQLVEQDNEEGVEKDHLGLSNWGIISIVTQGYFTCYWS